MNNMVMCQHSQDYETCRFGCTLRKKEELRLENDQLKERIEEVQRARKKINKRIMQILQGDIKVPKFEPKLMANIDLHVPENAYLWGWEAAVFQCGEILSKP